MRKTVQSIRKQGGLVRVRIRPAVKIIMRPAALAEIQGMVDIVEAPGLFLSKIKAVQFVRQQHKPVSVSRDCEQQVKIGGSYLQISVSATQPYLRYLDKITIKFYSNGIIVHCYMKLVKRKT